MDYESDEILNALDDEQREAAQSLLGPTVILAGAGTGKTRTITHRIAYGILRGDFSENRVMALTYTNKAAGELRARLRQLGVHQVNAKTFHAAAISQLEYFWREYFGIEAPRVLESKAKAIGSAADSLKIKLDPSNIRDLAAEIEWRKYSMLSLEGYAERMSTRPVIAGLSPIRAFEIQTAYEEAKVRAKQIDWEDVLLLCTGMLRAEPRALAHVHQQYRFFTVDEYQDISPLQQELLDTWLGDRSDLCVVGDPNQTIYSFTGASATFLENFESRYPGANVISLTKNYRSTPEIIQIANRLRSNQNLGPLESVRPTGLTPQVQSFEDRAAECAWIANQIKDARSKGVQASQIAVLYRINGQSEYIEKALADAGVEYQVRGGQRYFNRPEIMAAVRLVRAEAMNPTGKELYETVSAIARSLGWQSIAPDLSGSQLEQWEALNAFVQIADELGKDATINTFASELEERQRSQHEPTRESITLSTIHAAKGLEYKLVFILGATEGYLPISYAKTEAQLNEEQRLFYVAVTRAKDQLHITWPKRDTADDRQRTPSRYLDLI
ncbi:MAG: ATP-dependent helicase [Micrococcales bacterium]|nr:ATP-dependent helicase [Actinomycetota bacterium]NCA07385.1 ATP-dependent helicase [Micrococcales bacterium]